MLQAASFYEGYDRDSCHCILDGLLCVPVHDVQVGFCWAREDGHSTESVVFFGSYAPWAHFVCCCKMAGKTS